MTCTIRTEVLSGRLEVWQFRVTPNDAGIGYVYARPDNGEWRQISDSGASTGTMLLIRVHTKADLARKVRRMLRRARDTRRRF